MNQDEKMPTRSARDHTRLTLMRVDAQIEQVINDREAAQDGYVATAIDSLGMWDARWGDAQPLRTWLEALLPLLQPGPVSNEKIERLKVLRSQRPAFE